MVPRNMFPVHFSLDSHKSEVSNDSKEASTNVTRHSENRKRRRIHYRPKHRPTEPPFKPPLRFLRSLSPSESAPSVAWTSEQDMSTLIAIREASLNENGGEYSPAKEKASNRRVYGGRSPLLCQLRMLLGGAKYKLLLLFCLLTSLCLLGSKISSFMGWNPHNASSVYSPSRGGYTVLINTWKRNSLLKQSVAHYASCQEADDIRVVWSESDPPSLKLREHLMQTVLKKSQTAHKPNFRFDLNEDDNLNNRFKPIEDLRTDVIFSVDDDVIIPCRTLDYAFTVWQTAPLTMVGFVPRVHCSPFVFVWDLNCLTVGTKIACKFNRKLDGRTLFAFWDLKEIDWDQNNEFETKMNRGHAS